MKVANLIKGLAKIQKKYRTIIRLELYADGVGCINYCPHGEDESILEFDNLKELEERIKKRYGKQTKYKNHTR